MRGAHWRKLRPCRSRLTPAGLGVARVAATAFLLGLLALDPAWPQSAARPTITVAAAISAVPATQAPLPIRVAPLDTLPRNSFVRVRGLPPMAALSEGHSIAPGSWAVSLAALPNLKLTLPPGATGRADIVVTLVSVDGVVLAEAKAAVTAVPAQEGQAQREASAPPAASASILRAGVSPPAPDTATPSGPAPQAAAPPMTPQDRERVQRLMKKGDEHLTEGNVAAARLVYERAAEAGLAQAAMALAATFDEGELARLAVRGIQPDSNEARRWYERARQLGAADADQRLRRLGSR